MSKYDPLRRFLEARPGDEIPMTFSEIEKVLGFVLPDSARKFPAWWSNNTGTQVAVSAWRDAGYRTTRVDIPSGRVTFVRDFDPERGGMGVREGGEPFVHRTPDASPPNALVIPFDGLSLSAL